jgi:flagellar P-ring protein precursor FlgI
MNHSSRCATTHVAILAALTIGGYLCGTMSACAAPRLESICTVYGQREIQLRGVGLVVGLKGTGDSASNGTLVRAVTHILGRLRSPVNATSIGTAKNAAVVLLEATVPKGGIRRGQKVHCTVSSLFDAKSLKGGYLLTSPLAFEDLTDDRVVGLASGPVELAEIDTPTQGQVMRGVELKEDVYQNFVDHQRNVITLLLDESHASFRSAFEIAEAINSDLRKETTSSDWAKAMGSNVIEIQVPTQYLSNTTKFMALLMQIQIDSPPSEARVVVNRKKKIIVITGDVEISPVAIAHNNLRVKIDAPAFLGVQSTPGGPVNPARLDNLVQALNQLQVPTEDTIDILRTLYRSGKLHAQFVEEK